MTHRRLILAGLPLVLASCSGILPKPPPPPALYRLTPLGAAATAGPPLDAQLVVEPVAAADSLDTTRIALRRGPFGFDYFANAAWTDRAPALVQSLIVESLEPHIRVVAAPSGAIRADAVLVATLRRFEADYGGAGPAEAEVRLDCMLVRPPERTVLAVRSFTGTAPASANDVPEIVSAFDTALHAALGGLPPWIASSLGTARR